jgi:phage anti-repressor protein
MLVNIKFDSVLKVNSVDARELHKALEVGKDFSEWIKSRIDDIMAEKNVDFIESPVLGSRGIKKNCVIRIDYKITLSSAKEIAMLERNEVGKRVRKYFIQCEEELRNRRSKGDELSVLNSVSRELCAAKRLELEGKTDNLGYFINIAKVENKLSFGYHETDMRRNLSQAQQARLNSVLKDVALLAVLRGITNPTEVYNALISKYSLDDKVALVV